MSNHLRLPGKLGAKAPDFSRPHLLLSAHLDPTAVAPAAPPLADWLSRVPEWPFYQNQVYGDCVWAMTGHMIEAWTTYASGRTVEVTDADVLKGYHDVTGFDPNDPGTDNGTVIADALSYWRKTGVGGHKIVAYARVDHTKLDHIQAAIDLFGAVAVGVQLPAIAQEQFANEQPWDVVIDDGGIEGGHAISLGAYDADKKLFGATTWGAVQLVTFAWAQTYITEVWAPITQDWIEANGSTPGGLAAFALGEDFAALTGKSNPFPHPSPQPTPGPAPTPTPVPPGPPVADPDQALAVAARAWLTAGPHHSRADRACAGELRSWLHSKGL